MSKKKRGKKKRVQFRQNREVRRRSDDWTQRYKSDRDTVEDAALGESVRAKGALSRKRTIMVGEDELPLVDAAQWHAGVVTAVHGLICYVRDDAGRDWETTVRRVLRTLLIETRSPVTVGDRVWFSDQSKAADGELVGVVEQVEDRRSILSRRDRRGRQHAIVANADQLLIVGSVAQPGLKPHLIDRYLVAAEKGRLRPIVCVNKMDLAGREAGIDAADRVLYTQTVRLPDEFDPEDEGERLFITAGGVLDELRALGYRCICTSVETGEGLGELREALRDHVTVLSGQSGVGKSSLINALQPGLELRVGDVSTESEKGRHTTTHARLLPLDFGHVVDTPGIRAFDLWDVDPAALEALFPEFAPHLQHCEFGDCLHTDEEGCAVRNAALEGRISLRRYLSYLKMYDDALTELRR
jgi:ribosome biogenesis GTPase